MPPTAKKPTPKPKPKAENRPVEYPVITVNGVPIPDKALIIDEQRAKDLLGWETEADCAKRLTAADPKLKAARIQYGDNFLLFDLAKNKVRCERNSHNRPFDETHCDRLSQDILDGHYQLNGETIIINLYADLDSGQHRLIGLVKACEKWRASPKGTYPAWPDSPPVIRSLVVCGTSADPAVLRTIDNVKPRSLTDVFYTSPLFAKLNPPERKECSRMMDYAVDLLWKRLGMDSIGGQKVFQTHSTSIEFADTHPRIQQAIKHVFEENKEGRAISSLRISAGHAAAMQYLMAASGNDDAAETYLASYPRTEKQLDLGLWEKAEEFITELAAVDREEDADGNIVGFTGELAPVVESLVNLVDPDGEDGAMGRNIEKLATLTLGWIAWRDKGKIEHADLDLTDNYLKDPATNVTRFVNEPTLGGPDKGSGKAGADAKLAQQQIEQAKEEARAAKVAKMDAKAKGKEAAAGPALTQAQAMAKELTGQFDAIAAANPGVLIIVKSALGNYTAWLDAATTVATAAGSKPKEHPASKLPQFLIPAAEFDSLCAKLQAEGHRVGIALYDGATKQYNVTEVAAAAPVEAPAAKPKPVPKPKAVGTPPKPALRGGTT